MTYLTLNYLETMKAFIKMRVLPNVKGNVIKFKWIHSACHIASKLRGSMNTKCIRGCIYFKTIAFDYWMLCCSTNTSYSLSPGGTDVIHSGIHSSLRFVNSFWIVIIKFMFFHTISSKMQRGVQLLWQKNGISWLVVLWSFRFSVGQQFSELCSSTRTEKM